MAKKASKTTDKLKEAEARNVELMERIRQLTEELEVVKAKNKDAVIDMETLTEEAVNVRFDEEEGIYVFDVVAYSPNGVAALKSSEPVAADGHSNKREHAFKRMRMYVGKDLKEKLSQGRR